MYPWDKSVEATCSCRKFFRKVAAEILSNCSSFSLIGELSSPRHFSQSATIGWTEKLFESTEAGCARANSLNLMAISRYSKLAKRAITGGYESYHKVIGATFSGSSPSYNIK
ncbi:hypothetical protein N7530_009803 [Penicillium desertorum]|uniref:Uncharacterized protein n=1 Tax=Penicillium desertorum TaxID=1303715 RepID=A0A9X0BIQ8_9EURO|nr:hypothetical protein N7530_009803 [Penicillium desertorum]